MGPATWAHYGSCLGPCGHALPRLQATRSSCLPSVTQQAPRKPLCPGRQGLDLHHMDQTSHMISPRGPARRVPRPPLEPPKFSPRKHMGIGGAPQMLPSLCRLLSFPGNSVGTGAPTPQSPGGPIPAFRHPKCIHTRTGREAGRSCRHQPACPQLCREPSAQGSGWEAGGMDPGPGQGGRAASPTHAVRKARDALAAPAGLTASPGPRRPLVQARRTQVLKVVDGEPRLHRATTGSQDCHLGWGEGVSD